MQVLFGTGAVALGFVLRLVIPLMMLIWFGSTLERARMVQ